MRSRTVEYPPPHPTPTNAPSQPLPVRGRVEEGVDELLVVHPRHRLHQCDIIAKPTRGSPKKTGY